MNFINFQGCFCHQAKMRVIRLEGKMNAELQLPNETFIDEVFLNLDLKEVDQTFLISETTRIRIIKHCSYRGGLNMVAIIFMAGTKYACNVSKD